MKQQKKDKRENGEKLPEGIIWNKGEDGLYNLFFNPEVWKAVRDANGKLRGFLKC